MSKKNGKPGLWQEFKDFINKGNAMALAVGWDSFGRNDAKAETPVLWPPHAKS